MLIVLLLLLTAGIVFLAVILPRLPTKEKQVGASAFSGRTFYLLSVGRSDEYLIAATYAQDAVSRGGGGYIYNDGRYHAIAAAYARESEAKALADINDGAYYLTIDIPQTDNETDAAVVKYVCGDFFTELSDAAVALDRGTITEAAADYIVFEAVMRLNNLTDGNMSLDVDYERGGGGRNQLSYIRYIIVKALVGVYDGLRFSA